MNALHELSRIGTPSTREAMFAEVDLSGPVAVLIGPGLIDHAISAEDE